MPDDDVHNFTVQLDTAGGDFGLVGNVAFSPEFREGDLATAKNLSPRPVAFRLRTRTGYINVDDDGAYQLRGAGGAVGVRLTTNDPRFDLPQLPYRADFDLHDPITGEPVPVHPVYFPAPPTDTTVLLVKLIAAPGRTSIVATSAMYASQMLDAGTPGSWDALVVPSDFDFRLDDTRIPTPGSITPEAFSDALTLVMQLLSAIEPNVLRLGEDTAGEDPATQVELWADGVRTGFFNSTGLIMSQPIRVGANDFAASSRLYLNSAAGQFRQIGFQTGGLLRFDVLVSNDGEGVGDVGSDLYIRSFHNDGSLKANLLSLSRQTGLVYLGGLLSTLPSAAGGAGLRLPPGVAPTSPVNGDVWLTDAGVYAQFGSATWRFLVFRQGGAVTAAGTTTLSVSDPPIQIFTGTTTQTVKLPTTGVLAGQAWTVINQSSGAVAVQSSAANAIVTVGAGKRGTFTALVDTPTTAANWDQIAPDTSGGQRGTTVVRDSDSYANAAGYVVTPNPITSAGGTTTLTRAAGTLQIVTGSASQTVKLPTTNILAGLSITVISQTSGTVTVQSSDATTITTLANGDVVMFMPNINTPTTGTHWRRVALS